MHIKVKVCYEITLYIIMDKKDVLTITNYFHYEILKDLNIYLSFIFFHMYTNECQLNSITMIADEK